MTVLDPEAFSDLLGYFSVRFDLEYFQEDSGRTGGGDDVVADLADPLWIGDIASDPDMTHAEAAAAQALVALLDGVIGRFYMCDPRLPYPIKDPTGALLGAAAPRILEINANRTALRIERLPGFYQLSLGDRFHSEYGSSPVHRAYHWICGNIQANDAGTTGMLTVRPHLPIGLDVGDAIELRKPSPLWRMVAKSAKAGTGQGQKTPGPSWQMIQVP